ncbi:hypothetical protein Micbo1qcDRAFT_44281 [Microdochium bolleyi]|uniref:RING-type E3 ubiquitin transferase n=1 Tax=Microdochium bolleyi TaxID=196109 RepID=A0A136JBA9_9PEZI|nr:hypothetical protein Micbo1qcDRAFT_44281 [Microdochium bolleyi]
MFTTPASSVGALPSSQTTSSPASAAPARRHSRLRGLIHLRSYTQPLSYDSDNTSSARQPVSSPGRPSTLTRTRSAVDSPTSFHSEPARTLDSPNTVNGSTTRAAGTLLSSRLSLERGHDALQTTYVAAPAAPTVSPTTAQGRLDNNPLPASASQAVRASAPNEEAPLSANMTRSRSATTGDASPEALPSLRLTSFFDARSNRPSLTFTPVSRTLPTGTEVIKVGRYSERENQVVIPTNIPSAAPVGFKSKVVSRRHCEFWHEDGRWYVKDVKSSSGTFLNHIRLSAPGTESKPYPLNDGDIVQLGIDFKGGEEMIYRCVKMRVELNRGWQSKPNTFNMATHQRLRNMTNASSTSAASHAQDCSICLNNIAPCQSLFVAPCSHTWHYKCIRELLMGPSYPIFMCPNCRAATDLDADVEEPPEEWQQLDSGVEDVHEENAEPSASPDAIMENTNETNASVAQPDSPMDAETSGAAEDTGDMTMRFDRHSPPRNLSSPPLAIPGVGPSHPPRAGSSRDDGTGRRRTPSPKSASLAVVTEGPLTPRNDAGPWVFDGNPARVSQDVPRPNAMSSLDAAASERQS